MKLRHVRPCGRPGARFRAWPAAVAAGLLLAALPMTAASAQAAGKPDVPKPTVPTAQGFASSPTPACSTDRAAPTLLGDTTPQLTAVVHVAAGSTRPDYLRGHFDIQARQAPRTWTEAASESAPSASSTVRDGTPVTTSVKEPLSVGTLYRMAASTWSYTGDDTQYLASPRTAWCYFTIDPTAPLAPTVTFGGPYTECLPNDCAPHGGPDVPGTFTFAPGAGDTGVVAYEYQLTDSTWAVVQGSPATVTLTTQRSGTAVLTVRAQDRAGRWGSATQVLYNVAPPAASVGRWHFDDAPPGDTTAPAADTATGAGDRHPAALSATGADRAATGRRGAGDGALALDGVTGYAATGGQVLDPASSFAVSAHVFAADLAQDRTALSQTGADGSGFALRYDAGDEAWQFSYAWNDGGSRHVAYAEAPAGAERVWTQLAGSYDAAAHTLTLYVDGRQQGAPVTLPATASAAAASGDLEFGRDAVAGAPGSYGAYWDGFLDEAQAWPRKLSAGDAAPEAELTDQNGWPALAEVAAWNASGASGTALTDTTTGYGRTLTTENGAQLDGTALVLDGVDDAATTPGPVVDENGSFTVSAVVQPDMSVISGKPAGWTGQVVGRRAADGSAWGIAYTLVGYDEIPDPDSDGYLPVPVTQWTFGRFAADGTFTGVVAADITEWLPGTANDPVRVTGVVDAQSGTATLFLGSTEEGTAPFTPASGAGELTVGRAWADGGWTDCFPGRVTSLSMWAGAVIGPQLGTVTAG
ncbi:LamG domain-containing protein [Streptomyces sp. NPDC021224]|uniref:LamG domain-containing protein n=1 Tax=unclassified Streptomyces TaxID=2593676 RepID=UPI00379F66B7